MEDRLPEFTPVRNKKEGYKGWIHATTNMQELFTGNKDSGWQYTITVAGDEKKRVASAEDLEVITDSKEFPLFLLPVIKHPKSGFTEETRLHMLGYRITGMDWSQRWNILINVAIPILGPLEVVATIADLIYSRLPNAKIAERNRYALIGWKKDLDMVLDRFGDDSDLKNPELIAYINGSYNAMKNFLSL